MIDKDDILKYKNIKAPEGLKERIVLEEEKSNSFSKRAIFLYATAAVLFLIVGALVFMPSHDFELYYGNEIVNGEIVVKAEVPSLVRTVSLDDFLDIPLRIEGIKDAEISVSKGEIETGDDGSFVAHIFESDLPVVLTINEKNESHSYSIFINDKNEIVLSIIKK